MDSITTLILLLLLAFFLAGPVMGIFAWARTRSFRRRIFDLEQRIMDLTTLEARVAVLVRKVKEAEKAEASGGGAAEPAGPPAEPAGPPAEPATDSPVVQPAEVRVPPTAAAEIAGPEPSPLPEPTAEAGSVAGSALSREASETPSERPGAQELAPPSEAPAGTPAVDPLQEPVVPAAARAATAAAAPTATPPPQPPPPPEAGWGDQGSTGPPKIEWERWIGLRGAAVLGGIVLALAGALFLKFSIEAGYFPPPVRVTLAIFAGLGCLAFSQSLRRQDYVPTANALAGAGVVILYGALWAAQALYGLIGAGTAFGLMTLVTLVCGLLSWRHRSWVVAGLGLAGGFATPAVLTSVDHNPLSLFSYLVLLNLGVLVLARKRGWPILGLCSLALTTVYQMGWLFGGMGDGDVLLALGVVAVFAVLYAVTAGWQPWTAERDVLQSPWLGPAAAVSIAFLFALKLSGRAVLSEHQLPFLGLLLLLSAAALWLARVHQVAWLPLAAAGANIGAVFNWLRISGGGRDQEWLVIGASLVLAAAFQGAVEWLARRPWEETSPEVRGATLKAAVILTFALLSMLTLPLFVPDIQTCWPWLFSWFALGALLIRQSSFEGYGPAQVLAALGLGIGFWILAAGPDPATKLLTPTAYFAIVFLACGALQLLGLKRSGPGRRWADAGAALLPLIVLLGLVMTDHGPLRTPLVFLGSSLLLAFLMVLAATRQRSGGAYAGAAAVLALAHFAWTADQAGGLAEGELHFVLLLQGLAVLFLTFWPRLAGRAFAEKRWAWYAAALAGPAWFLPLREIYTQAFGDQAIGLLPVALGALSLGAVFSLRRFWREDEPLRRTGLAWFSAVALGFVALAIPLQLDKEWITVGWALQAVATVALWRRLDHPGLKYFSLGLLSLVTIRLVANPAVLGYHPVSGIPLFNWLSYTYLVPAACLLGAAYLLHDLEVQRLRPAEKGLYAQEKPVGAAVCGLAAIIVVFAWINLSIVDFFSTGTELAFSFERAAARDLTTSLAWTVYAVLLLAIGIHRRWAVLRWVSLAFLILTIAKVFLYDLGELEDLYRVASLVGLAVSLILVSLVYQRFVFRREPEPPEPPAALGEGGNEASAESLR